MFRRSYLAVCVAAAVGIHPAIADTDNENNTETLTVVGSASDAKPLPLEIPAQASKLGVAVEELPYSVSIIDQDFISETGAKNIQDALLYTSGVYAGAFGADTRGDFSKIRGVDPINYVDGLRYNYQSYNNVRPNTYALEQIEVLKGPSSVLFGQGSVGGIVNAVTKRPKAEQEGEIWAQVGSFDRKQLSGDWTGAINEDETLLFRIVGQVRDSGTQVDHVDDDELLINPSLTWQPSEDTRLTVMANYQKREGGITAQFLPTEGTLVSHALGFVDPSTFVGEPGWDRYDREQASLTVEFEQQLTDDWRFKAVSRYLDAETSTREHYARIGFNPDASGNVTRVVTTSDRSTSGLNFDLRLNGEFDLANTEHKVLIGLDRQNITTDEWNKSTGFNGTINLFNPVYGNLPTIGATTDPDAIDTEQTGLYIADHISIGNVIVSAALRKDFLEINQGSTNVDKSATTGHIGLMYQFASGLSPYVSYSESFEPNTGDDGNGGILDPTEGVQMEYGIKYVSEDGDTAATLAYFDIEQLNRVVAGSTPGGLEQVGALIDGWEFTLNQRWNRFNLLFNYSDINATNGQSVRLPYVAEQQASLWGNYKFDSNWRVGLGARYTGTNVGWGGAPEVDSVTLYDAMIGYEMGDWDFSADIKNLTNETYIAWCRSSGTDCGFGEKLNATLNARYKF